MKIETKRQYSRTDIDYILESLKEKHESLELLYQRLLVSRCSAPEYIDDYMLWRAIKRPDAILLDIQITFSPEIFGALSERRMELLDFIFSHNPGSIKELSEQLNRDYKNVYDDIKALEKAGLIAIVRQGKNKVPTLKADNILISFEK